MKVLRRDMRTSTLKLAIESLDDLWYLSQIVAPGDIVRSKTQRRIKDGPDKRSSGGERKTIMLAVSVERTEFKPETKVLRIAGTIEAGPEDLVSMGSHHTFNVDADSILTIQKDRLTKADLDIASEAVAGTLRPKVVIVSMDEGEASVGLVRESATEYIDIGANIGGKYDTSGRGKRQQAFYKELAELIASIFERENVSTLIIAGPGFAKGAFHKSLLQTHPKIAKAAIMDDTGSAGRNGIQEVMKRGSMHKALESVSSAKNSRLVEEILEHIGKDTGLVAYGFKEVKRAVDAQAAEMILATDDLFFEKRQSIEPLFRGVKKARGKAHIVNHDQEAGQKLSALGGLAARLRFRI